MPMRRHLYPDDWEQIVKEVNARAGNKCEWCKAPNGHTGRHVHPLDWRPVDWWARQTASLYGVDATKEDCPPGWFKFSKVVLTTAHLDAEGGVCQCEKTTGRKCGIKEHLAALCNRCHLSYDHPRHIRNAKASRRRKTFTIQPELFEEPA